MKTNRLLILVMLFIAVPPVQSASAAVMISVESVTVQNVPVGSIPISAFVEITVQNDNPATQISGFQIQAKLPDLQTDAVFNSVDNTVLHPALLPATGFITQIESRRILSAKLDLAGAPLEDDGGLIRLRVDIAAGFTGVVPLTLVSLTDDPDFGTVITDGTFAAIDAALASGTITVVIPEPGTASLILPSLFGAFRRRSRAFF